MTPFFAGRRFPSWLMLTWLALGYGVVHATVILWGASVLQAVFSTPTPYERVQFFAKHGPLLETTSAAGLDTVYRRLDGTVVTEDVGRSFESSAHFSTSHLTGEIGWSSRLLGYSDLQSPAVSWYLVTPPNRHGYGYFTGYEEHSKRHVGYLGKRGFSIQVPVDEDAFQFVSPALEATGHVASFQRDNFYYSSSEPSSSQLKSMLTNLNDDVHDAVWILSQGTLYEIQLGERTTKVLLDNRPDLRQLTRMYARSFTGGLSIDGVIESPGKSGWQLVLRTDDGMLLLDPETQEQHRITVGPLPAGWVESLIELPNGDRYVTVTRYGQKAGEKSTILVHWIGKEGEITRTETVELSRAASQSFDPDMSIVLPVPLILVLNTIIAPAFPSVDDVESSTYFTRMQTVWKGEEVWAISTVIVGLLVAVAVRWRERKVFRNSGWMWPVAAGLFGWFGWMAYICLRPLPAKQSNGAWMPAQPEPNRPLGTEIFA